MKRKHLGIFLCVIAVVGVLFTVALQKKDSKSEIFSFVRENQTHLSQFVCDTMEAGKIVSTYRNWSVDYYEGVGAVEFLHNESRYCLWLKGASPKELKSMPLVMQRIANCKETRNNSVAAAIMKNLMFIVIILFF